MKVQLRAAEEGDRAHVQRLVVELGYVQLAEDHQRFAAAFHAVLADPQRHTWLAEVDGKVCGLMTLSTRPQLRLAGLQVTIEELVVREDVRGAGVGTALVEQAKAHARDVNAKRLELTTNRTRPVYTRGFYVKRGFVEVNSAVMRFEPKR